MTSKRTWGGNASKMKIVLTNFKYNDTMLPLAATLTLAIVCMSVNKLYGAYMKASFRY